MAKIGWVCSIGKAVSCGYKKFSGQSTFEEADALYESVKKNFEKHKSYFQKKVDKISNEIESQVIIINKSKERIKKELFPQFAEKMKALKDIPVSSKYMKENFLGTSLKVDEMKLKADLYLIDFKKQPFKSNALAVITLGILTRKRAKETKNRVIEEKSRLDEEISRIKAELTKLQMIKEALTLIAEYYETLTELYFALLFRIDNAIGYLMIKCINESHRFIQSKMSIKLLPISQQNEILSLVTISKILKEMVERSVTMTGNSDTISTEVSMTLSNMQEQRKIILTAAV